MADGLGTPGGIVSALEHRLDQGGMIASQGSTSLVVRTGVMAGPNSTALITGTSATGTMTVNVLPHHWVTSRGTADGPYLGTKEASTTVAIAAAPGTNSRIDVVYVKQQDSASAVSPDGTIGELYGVVTGTAAASPVKPSLPVGAEELGTVTVAAGATNTLGAGITISNTARVTVARGARIPVRNQADRDTLTRYAGLEVYRIDTGDIEAVTTDLAGWSVVDGQTWTSFTPTLRTAAGSPSIGNGTLTGRYKRSGKAITVRIFFSVGSTTNSGAGVMTFDLPFTAVSDGSFQNLSCKAYTSGNTSVYAGAADIAPGGTFCSPLFPGGTTSPVMTSAQSANAGGTAGTGIPLVPSDFSFKLGSNLSVWGIYEAA